MLQYVPLWASYAVKTTCCIKCQKIPKQYKKIPLKHKKNSIESWSFFMSAIKLNKKLLKQIDSG